MKIDCHIHVTPPDLMHVSEKIKQSEPYFAWLSSSKQNKFATGEEVVHQLDEAGFDQGVIFGFAFRDMGLCQYVNDYVAEQRKQYAERLIGFMVVPPEHKQAAYEIQRGYDMGLRGIGELFPEGQGFDLTTLHGKSDLATCCEKWQLPVLLHTNETVGHEYIGKTKVSLKEIETFVRHHSKTPIILAHWGGGFIFYETMKEVRALCEHVYYDTAAMLFLYEPSIYKVASEIGILDKVLFGSDYPLVNIQRYEEGLAHSQLDEKERKGILGRNFEQMLKRYT